MADIFLMSLSLRKQRWTLDVKVKHQVLISKGATLWLGHK